MFSSPIRSGKASKLSGIALASVTLSFGIGAAATASTPATAGSTKAPATTAGLMAGPEAVGSSDRILPHVGLRTNGANLELTPQWNTNWSGYVDEGTGYKYTLVQGQWTVPTAYCTAKENSTSLTWVGLDGLNSVEQDGTESECVNGVPKYYAWTEMVPQQNVRYIADTPQPGDVIEASVTSNATGTKYQMVIQDLTHKWTSGPATLNPTASPPDADAQAEWVTELEQDCGTPCSSLTHFSTVGFTQAFATGNGNLGVISSFPYYSVDMDTVGDGATESGTMRALVSSLSASGSAFEDHWVGH